jgi:HlyD family secretion protein
VGDGKKIQPGMPIQVTPDNVERQRFGGITGVVTSVSPLPVTMEGSRALVGNAEVVQGLMQGGAHIEVTSKLDADPKTASGYRWSSSGGPPLAIGSGLTTSVRVTVENRAPLTYVLPFLREITGVY